MRFPLEVFDAVRAAFSSNRPVTMRVSGTDWARGLITQFEQAETILSTGDADMVALARAILYNPRWPWHAAAHFGASVTAPNQYLRS